MKNIVLRYGGHTLQLQRIWEYVLVLICIMATDTVTIFNESIHQMIFVIAIGGILFFICLSLNRISIDQNLTIFLLLPIAFVFMSQLFNLDASLGFEYKIMLLLSGYMIATLVSWEHFCKIYIDWMLFITVFSLCVYLLVMTSGSWWSVLPQTNEGDTYSLVFAGITADVGNQFRNFGPFWEPGVFQMYLNFAFFFQAIGVSEIQRWKNVILIVGLLTTFSTTGYICFALIIILYFLQNSLHIKVKHILYFIISVTAILLVFNNVYIQELVFDKFNSSSKSNASYMIRLMNLEIYLEQWVNSPIFGQGITDSFNNTIASFSKSLYSDYEGSVSTTLREFACMGGYFGLSRVLIQWKFSHMFSKKKSVVICVFLIMMMFLNTEDLIYSLFANTIFYYAITEKSKRGTAF